MPDVVGRLRAVASAFIAALLLVGLIGPASTNAVDPPNIERFMAALGEVESNGRYDAVNSSSGAMGKYQIMPSNWRAWAKRYLGNADAAPTPANQDAVARGKLTSLYTWLGAWAPVAHWWLTGDGSLNPNRWSNYSRRYVNKIMGLMGEALLPARPAGSGGGGQAAANQGGSPEPTPQGRVYDDNSIAIGYSDQWGEAEFARYNGAKVSYATEAGATAAFAFAGTRITLIGPKGPTRGQANVYLDDQLVGTINAHASRFQARVELFAMPFERRDAHTLRIEVLGTPGHAMVAIDEFVVTGWRSLETVQPAIQRYPF